MCLDALSRQTAQIAEYSLCHLGGKAEREFVVVVRATQIGYVECVLPKEDAHPLLRHGDIGALKFVLQAEGSFVATKLLLSKSKCITRSRGIRSDGDIEDVEKSA